MTNKNDSHNHIQALLSHYRDWDEGERALVAGHLAECQRCADELASYQAMDSQMRQLPLAKPAPAVRQNFYEAVSPARNGWFQGFSTAFAALNQVGAVALLVLVVAGIFLTIRNISQPTTTLAPANHAPTHMLEKTTHFPIAEPQAVALNLDGQLLAFATDTDIQIWNITSQRLLHQFPLPFTSDLTLLKFTNALLVAFFDNGMNQSWHLGTGEMNTAFEVDVSNFGLFSQSESLLWMREQDGELIFQPIRENKIKIIATGIENPPIQAIDVAISRQTHVVFADELGVVYLYDKSGALVWKMPAKSPILQLSLSENSQTLASLNNQHEIEIWAGADGQISQTIPLGIAPQKIRLLPDGTGVFVLYPDNSITIWDTNTGEPMVNYAGIPPLNNTSTTFTFTNNGFVIATLSETGIDIWEKP